MELREYALVWASPPCQGRTAYKRRPNHVRAVDTDGMIRKTRRLLRASGVPYVIENVPGAPLESPLLLCGSMFGLDVRRHRVFETSFDRGAQLACRHEAQRGSFAPATNRKNRRRTCEVGVWRIPLDVQQEAMGGGPLDVARGAQRGGPAGVRALPSGAVVGGAGVILLCVEGGPS